MCIFHPDIHLLNGMYFAYFPFSPDNFNPKKPYKTRFQAKICFWNLWGFLSEKFYGAFEKIFENLIFCFNFFENFSLISPIFTKIRPQQLSFQPIFSRSFVLFLHCSFLILVLTPFRIHFSNLSLTFHHTAQCSTSLHSPTIHIPTLFQSRPFH